MKANRGIILILCLIVVVVPILVINSGNELERKIRDVTNQITERVKNIELVQGFIVDMPALRGAIEFQSFGQIDVVVKKMMAEEPLVKEFFILDHNLNVLHSVYGSYQEMTDTNLILSKWDKKSPYAVIGNAYYIFRKTTDESSPAYVVMKIDIGHFFNSKMSAEDAVGIVFRSTDEVELKKKIDIPVYKNEGSTRKFFVNYFRDNFLSYLLLLLSIFIILEILMRLLVKPFQKVVYFLQNLSSRELQGIELEKFPRPFKPFIVNIIEANEQIVSANQKEREIEFQKFQFKVAQQVAHDIRSPLSVLKSLKNELTPNTEEARRVFQISLNRIEEIILNLLKTNDHVRSESENRSEDLLTLLENVLIEKKAEFRNREDVEIESSFTSLSYGLHSQIRPSHLKRIISNIINNSVEAVGNNSCHIKVSLHHAEGKNVIEIVDNGPGIAAEFLPHIFEKGFTTKKLGNGLGLSGAKEELESVGGTISVESSLGKGVMIRIALPTSAKSSLLANKIDLYKYQKVIVLDDDFSIHGIWNRKLGKYNFEIEHFYSPNEILNKYQSLTDGILLLSDFEFVNDETDGIDVINKFGHKEHSILVTARSEEQEIRNRCEDDKIRFISKGLLSYIEINFMAPHIVLIDDDQLSHWRWKQFCEKRPLEFTGFYSIKDFLFHSKQFESNICILLDSDLGDGVRGEVDGEEIFNLGFTKVYLYTSYADGSFEKPRWVIDVLEKDPDKVLKCI